MVCENCGAPIEDGKTCPYCGAKNEKFNKTSSSEVVRAQKTGGTTVKSSGGTTVTTVSSSGNLINTTKHGWARFFAGLGRALLFIMIFGGRHKD